MARSWPCRISSWSARSQWHHHDHNKFTQLEESDSGTESVSLLCSAARVGSSPQAACDKIELHSDDVPDHQHKCELAQPRPSLPRTLIAIGSTGSGKSTFTQLLLNDLSVRPITERENVTVVGSAKIVEADRITCKPLEKDTLRQYYHGETVKIGEENLVGCTESMLTDYAMLISIVVDSLIQSKVEVDSIIAVVAEKQNDSRCSKLYEADDMIKLFLLLKKEKYITFFNHSLLIDIIEKFGDEKCEFSLKKFKAKFQTYCRNRVVQIPKSSWSELGLEYDGKINSDESVNEIIFKIDECFNNLSIERLQLFGEHVAKALGIDKSMLLLKSVRQGCVMVSYLLLAANLAPGELLSRLQIYFYRRDYGSLVGIKVLSMKVIFYVHYHYDHRNFSLLLEPEKCELLGAAITRTSCVYNA